jgi:hypothetical protein
VVRGWAGRANACSVPPRHCDRARARCARAALASSLYCSNVMRVEAIFPRSGRWGFYDGNGAFNAHDYWARRRRATAEQDPVGAPVWPWQSRSQPVPYLWRLVHRIKACRRVFEQLPQSKALDQIAQRRPRPAPQGRTREYQLRGVWRSEFGMHAAVVAPSPPIVRQPVARRPIASGSARRRSRQQKSNDRASVVVRPEARRSSQRSPTR